MSNFSVKWRGTFNLPAGNYTFNTVTSDGMRLYIDGVRVLDSWKDQQPTLYTINSAIVDSGQTGNSHLIEVEFYNKASGWPISYVWWNKQ